MLLFVAALSLALTVYRWWPIDGIIGNLFARGGHDTVWADGYSDKRWRAVRLGMCRDEVYNLIGLPIETGPIREGRVFESWTHSPGDTSYFQRYIEFKGDMVVEKINEFWLD
jgi:hypothetical protein